MDSCSKYCLITELETDPFSSGILHWPLFHLLYAGSCPFFVGSLEGIIGNDETFLPS